MATSVVDELVAALDAHDVDAVAATLAPDAALVLPQLDRTWTGASVADAVRALLVAFPDLSWHPARRYEGAGGKEFEEGVWVGTNTGPLAGHPPTGGRVSARSRVIYEHGGSAVRRVELYADLTALYRQLGWPTTGLPVSSAEFFAVDVPDEMIVHERPADLPPPSRGGRRGLAVLAAGAAVVLAAGAAFGVARSVGANTAASGHLAPPALPTASPAPPSPTPSPTPTHPPAVTTQGNRLIVSADVLFDTGSATLSPRAQQVISQVVAILVQRHVHGIVRVYGYTDNIGPLSVNMTLSKARAVSVVDALQKASPSLPVRYQAIGFGEGDPVASNATATGRAQNRRVTILLPTA